MMRQQEQYRRLHYWAHHTFYVMFYLKFKYGHTKYTMIDLEFNFPPTQLRKKESKSNNNNISKLCDNIVAQLLYVDDMKVVARNSKETKQIKGDY